jgi:hypothetical protein
MNLDPKTLDRLIPLDSASHAEVTGLCINIPTRYAECFATTADGRTARLRNRRQLLGWSMSAQNRVYYFRCGEDVIRIRTDSSRRRQIRQVERWEAFEACHALSGADPRVAELGPEADKIVAPDGSLLFIAPLRHARAAARSRMPRPNFQPALAT